MSEQIANGDSANLGLINYNFFFHPNCCHVCKKMNPGLLEACPKCRMISYCGKEHRMLHRQQHEKICQAIVNISMYINVWDSRNMKQKEWFYFKRQNLYALKDTLNRTLEPYEEQMFLFAKSCFICREQSNLIIDCQLCSSINTCLNHVSVSKEHNCQKLAQATSFDYHNSRMQDNSIPEIFFRMNINNFNDMHSVICDGLHVNVNKSLYVPSIEDYIKTDKLSGPLTLFHGMRNANILNLSNPPRNFFMVHIISGIFTNPHSISAWEVILHEFAPNTTLLILMIAPLMLEKYEIIQICQSCTDQGKTFQCDYYSMLYYNYIHLWHTKSDIIIGFDTVFSNDEMSLRIIKALQLEDCPILLTAKSEENAQEIVRKIQEVAGFAVTPIINEKNRFASGRLYRDYENDSAYFPNQHLIVYRNLCTPRSEINDKFNNNNV